MFYSLNYSKEERLSWCAMMTMDNRIEEFTHTICIQNTWLQPRRPTLRHETSWERNEETLSSENVVNVDKQMKYERVKWNMKELKGKENTQNSKTQDQVVFCVNIRVWNQVTHNIEFVGESFRVFSTLKLIPEKRRKVSTLFGSEIISSVWTCLRIWFHDWRFPHRIITTDEQFFHHQSHLNVRSLITENREGPSVAWDDARKFDGVDEIRRILGRTRNKRILENHHNQVWKWDSASIVIISLPLERKTRVDWIHKIFLMLKELSSWQR